MTRSQILQLLYEFKNFKNNWYSYITSQVTDEYNNQALQNLHCLFTQWLVYRLKAPRNLSLTAFLNSTGAITSTLLPNFKTSIMSSFGLL